MDRTESSAPPTGVRWAAENYYRLLGTHVAIRAELPAAARSLERLLAPFRCQLVEVTHRYSLTSSGLHRDQAVILRRSSQPEILSRLLSDLNRLAVDRFHGLAVHAGVVAQGHSVVTFPAVSGAGKSTLTAACLADGFQYVSDEALCIGFDHDDVVAYPKPLRLSPQAAALAGLDCPNDEEEMAVTADDLGARVAAGVLRLDHVVQLVRRPGPPEMRPRDRSEIVATLLTMSFNHFRSPLSSFWLVNRLAGRARAWRLEYDDPRAAASLLGELLVDTG